MSQPPRLQDVCANPKCPTGPKRGPGRVAGRYAPWVTLTDGSKVLKYCSVSCWRHYEEYQAKLPESQRDPDIGVILCCKCGGSEFDHGGHYFKGDRDGDVRCSIGCLPPLSPQQKAALRVLLMPRSRPPR